MPPVHYTISHHESGKYQLSKEDEKEPVLVASYTECLVHMLRTGKEWDTFTFNDKRVSLKWFKARRNDLARFTGTHSAIIP